VLLRLLYASGGRVSEIVNLRWRHVQPNGDSGQITVTGKGNKTRAIKLSKDTWAVLVQFMPPGATLVDFVFQSQRRKGQEARNGQLDRTAVNKIVTNAGKLIDVPKLSPHWFRHAHASHALDKGATVAVVQQTLGHTSLTTTSNF
jgi:integrase/recombinase XerD